MPWHGTERRHGDDPDTGERRRRDDIRALQQDVEDIQDELKALKRLPWGLARLTGKVEQIATQLNVLMSNMTQRFDGLDGKADKLTSFKTLVGYIAAILVPILVALIGGYFALKAALPHNP